MLSRNDVLCSRCRPMTTSGPNRPALAGGRLWLIVRGYLGACFVAAWSLAGGLILEDLAAGHRLNGQLSDFGVVVGGFFVVILVSAAPFATAAIMAAENLRLRAIWPFAAAGASIGIVIEAIASYEVKAASVPASGPIFALVAVVGALAGAVYWVLAGRGAPTPPVRDER